MSKKLPLYAVDKCPMLIRLPVEAKVKLDGMARDAGVAPASLAVTAVIEMVKDRPFTIQDLRRVNEIVEENIRKRDARKLEKGAF